MTTSGILRFESLADRNLSDLFSFVWKGDKDVSDILTTMYQLPSGKKAVSFVFVFPLRHSHDLFLFVFCPRPHTQVKLITVSIFLVVP